MTAKQPQWQAAHCTQCKRYLGEVWIQAGAPTLCQDCHLAGKEIEK